MSIGKTRIAELLLRTKTVPYEWEYDGGEVKVISQLAIRTIGDSKRLTWPGSLHFRRHNNRPSTKGRSVGPACRRGGRRLRSGVIRRAPCPHERWCAAPAAAFRSMQADTQ